MGPAGPQGVQGVQGLSGVVAFAQADGSAGTISSSGRLMVSQPMTLTIVSGDGILVTGHSFVATSSAQPAEAIFSACFRAVGGGAILGESRTTRLKFVSSAADVGVQGNVSAILSPAPGTYEVGICTGKSSSDAPDFAFDSTEVTATVLHR
jgi:hypothetical protein